MIPYGKGRALDLGCGEGFYAEYLKEKGYFTIGVDNNNEMLERASGKYDELLNLDVQKRLPFRDNYFEFILALEVLEHLENPVYTIKEINRVLKKNRRAIISVPNGLLNFEFFLQGHTHVLKKRHGKNYY